MKKYIVLALLTAAMLILSACSTGDDKVVAENGGTPSQTTTSKAPEESGNESTEENTEQPAEAEIPEDVQNVIDMFEADSFTTPDGTEVKLTEAVSQADDWKLYFDFAYIRYALPVYSDTVSDPGLYDFENFEFREGVYAELEQKLFKAVKGDVLDNGMTVVEASYAVSPASVQPPYESGVVLEGECELEGVLFRAPEDDYLVAKDEVLFYPNPASGVVPASYEPYMLTAINLVDLHDEFAFSSDGGVFSLGDFHKMDVDIADWFEDTVFVRVKVTLDGMDIRYIGGVGSQCRSTLKSAERLD